MDLPILDISHKSWNMCLCDQLLFPVILKIRPKLRGPAPTAGSPACCLPVGPRLQPHSLPLCSFTLRTPTFAFPCIHPGFFLRSVTEPVLLLIQVSARMSPPQRGFPPISTPSPDYLKFIYLFTYLSTGSQPL